MTEFKKVLVIGGGFAGIAAAIQARESDPRCQVSLLEKGDRLLQWLDRKGLKSYPIGTLAKPVNPCPDRAEVWQCQRHLLEKWDPAQLLQMAGKHLENTQSQQLVCNDLKGIRNTLIRSLEDHNVSIRLGFSAESVSIQPDGGFRVWSRQGEACEGSRLILASGGERNHGLRIAADLGVDVSPPVAAYVRLRLASPKLGDRMGPLERHVKVRCLKSGAEASGLMKISSRGLEGPVISSLSASQFQLWNNLDYALQLEVDWLPELAGASVLREIISRAQSGGKRSIEETPMFSLPLRSWSTVLRSSRLEGETPWSRIKMKKLQALANRIKADRIITSGMGLPEDERAWAGGIDVASLNQLNLEARATPGVFFAGEILDMHGFPGGQHLNLVWATAAQAGRAAAG